MIMTAKEMFKELGYKKYASNLWFEWYQNEEDVEITFHLTTKTVCASLDNLPLEITMSLLKAINQQVKELGWLDE